MDETEIEVVMAYNLGEGKARTYISKGKSIEYADKVNDNLIKIKE